jgi:hypothetical protein
LFICAPGPTIEVIAKKKGKRKKKKGRKEKGEVRGEEKGEVEHRRSGA